MHKLLILLLLFCACERAKELTLFEGVRMHVPYKIIIGSSLSPKSQKEVALLIDALFSEIDATYNNWNKDSEVSKLSTLKVHEKVALSLPLLALLEKIDELYKKSEGRFDVTIAPLLPLWKKGEVDNLPPVGWQHVHIQDGTFWKEEELSFDLCGIAKGHAVDLLASRLSASGYKNFYVEWGGEIKVQGVHPQGRPWRIAIEKLNQTVDLSDLAIATSGDYHQTWQIGEKHYYHIIDPRTKRPLTQEDTFILSATVIAPTCVLADALATTLMLFPTKEAAISWLGLHYPEATCYIIERNHLSTSN